MAATRAVKMAVQAASLRPTVVGVHQAVTTGHCVSPLAAMRALDCGGNAIDAEVTAA
jgi:gamma-glutamyltranspeptidase